MSAEKFGTAPAPTALTPLPAALDFTEDAGWAESLAADLKVTTHKP